VTGIAMLLTDVLLMNGCAKQQEFSAILAWLFVF